MLNYEPPIPEVRECSNPSTSKHMEDNLAPLSLLSLLNDVMKALQAAIIRGELDLDELDPNQVHMPETWVPREAVE